MYKVFLLILIGLTFVSDAFGQNYSLTAFGTEQIKSDQIQEKYTKDLDELFELYDADKDNYNALKEKLEARLNSNGSYAYLNIQYFKDYAGSISFIIDFVELADSAGRLNFKPSPIQQLQDPDSLVAKWQEYARISFALFKKGEINDMECPVIHCTWSFNHPQLSPFLDYFTKYAPKYKNELSSLLLHSDSSQFRSAAAFLLAHSKMAVQELVDLEMAAINDPAGPVRNNSMRVIYYAVRADDQIYVDLDRIIEALDYPSFTDRNKALVILRSMPLNNLSKSQLSKSIPILLEILEKKDAHNYRNAHTVIKKISREEHGIDELEKWQEWATRILK